MRGSDHVSFRPAEPSDDADIRKLLHEAPMHGAVRLATTRDPSLFASQHIDGDDVRTFVACKCERVVCVGQIAIRDRFFNGRPSRVGYLGLLRLAKSHAGRFDVLSRGYGMARDMLASLPTMPLFTSVAVDNARAMRVLCSGRRGLPIYTPVGELVTLLMTKTRSGRRTGCDRDTPGNRDPYQFAPVWDDSPRLWNQQPFKQVRVCAYAPLVSVARPVLNIVRRMTRQPILPRVGESVDLSYAILPAATSGRQMVEQLSALARHGTTQLLSIGLDARDPRLSLLRRAFGPTEYRTRIFAVRWPDQTPTFSPDDRLIYPEIATL